MRLLLVVVLVACTKPHGNDELWALVPERARGAIVISPRGITMLERGAREVLAMIDSSPDFALVKTQLAEWLAPVGGALPQLADMGFSSAKGAALFVMKDGFIAVLPVINRDAFLAKVEGTKGKVDTIHTGVCRFVRGNYACATSSAMLDTLGTGDLRRHLGTRGEIELVVEVAPQRIVTAAMQLTRGGATLRGTIEDAPNQLSSLLPPPTPTKLDTARTAGFARVDIAALIPATETPVVGDITARHVMESLDGPLFVTTPAGVPTLVAEQRTTDPTPLRAVVERCGEVPGSSVIEARAEDGGCTFGIPTWDISTSAKMDGDVLRIGRPPPSTATLSMSPLGVELARGTWSLAFWGRGTMQTAPKTLFDAGEITPRVAVAVLAPTLVTEAGFGARREENRIHILMGVRTIFENPDSVKSQILAIGARDLSSGRARLLVERIAGSAPDSPFASDAAAGHAGLFLVHMFVGAGLVLLPTIRAVTADERSQQ